MCLGPRALGLLTVAFAMFVAAAPVQAVYSEAARWGSLGADDGELNAPRGLAVDRSGDLLVADGANNRVQKFSDDGVFISKFGGPGSGAGLFNGPSDVAVASDGTILVADRGNSRVQRFSAAGAFLNQIGTPGTGPGQLNHPQSLTVAGTSVYVADLDNRRVQVFDLGGTFVRGFGGGGRLGNALAVGTFGVVSPPIDSTGDTVAVTRVGVLDSSQRVLIFSTDGSFLRAFGAPGTGESRFRFAGAADIVASPGSDSQASDVFVSDPGNDRVQKFDAADASFIEEIGVDELSRPRGLALDRDGNLFVSETESNRIRKYRFGPPPPEPGESGQVEVKRGTVKVKKRGSDDFVELEDAGTFPLGSVVDTTEGTIDLTVDPGRGSEQTAEVSKGMFKVGQTKGSSKTTELTLQGGSFSGCKARGARAARKPKSRKLFVKAKGRFRSIGRYSSATVRGTTWTMTDSCSGTRVKVTSGSVTVRDLKRKRNVAVRKGKSYLVRPPR